MVLTLDSGGGVNNATCSGIATGFPDTSQFVKIDMGYLILVQLAFCNFRTAKEHVRFIYATTDTKLDGYYCYIRAQVDNSISRRITNYSYLVSMVSK